ncbi:MAG: hypothetical protein AAFX99_35235, partial [Myxococcota bacterium]
GRSEWNPSEADGLETEASSEGAGSNDTGVEPNAKGSNDPSAQGTVVSDEDPEEPSAENEASSSSDTTSQEA